MKLSYLVLYVLILVAIAGCTTPQGAPTTPESPYIGGSQGLELEIQDLGIFNEESNTQEVFEGEAIPVEVTLRNKGEYEVQPGEAKVELLGIFQSDFTGLAATQLSNTEAIEKVSEFNEDGGEITLVFTEGNGMVDKRPLADAGFRDLSIFARYTTRYKTFALVPKVCFKEDLKDDTVCNIDESKDVFSSGAPIQVKKAEESRAGTGLIAVEFDVENVGGGESTIHGTAFDSRFNQFGFTVDEPSIWSCTSRGRSDSSRFDSNGKAKIRCKTTTPLPKGALYTRQLGLTLDYDYRLITHEQVRIINQES